MIASDTSADMAAMQLEVYRRMGPARRLQVALELSDLTHTFALAGMKQRNPGMTDEEAHHALAVLLYS